MSPRVIGSVQLLLRLLRAFLLLLAIAIAMAAPFARVEGTSPRDLLVLAGSLLVVTEAGYRIARFLLRVAGHPMPRTASPFAPWTTVPDDAPDERGPSPAKQVLETVRRHQPVYPAKVVAITRMPLAEVEALVAALARHDGIRTDDDGRWVLGPKAPPA